MEAISIIICSKNGRLEKSFYKNLKETIGSHHEIIVIDNSSNKYSVFQAYNIGIRQSAGGILCFIHEDIKFHTPNWGGILKIIFAQQPETGLIGVAGTRVKTKMPSGWWDCANTFRSVNIIQHRKNEPPEKLYYGFVNDGDAEVMAVDGVFMAMIKDDRIKFNEKLKGYHNYDLNLSIEHLRFEKKIVVTNKILIEHFSEGNLDYSWYKSTYEFHKAYKKQLPLIKTGAISEKWQKSLEFNNGKYFVEGLINYHSIRKAFFLWLELVRLHPLSKFHGRFIKLLFTYKKRNPLKTGG